MTHAVLPPDAHNWRLTDATQDAATWDEADATRDALTTAQTALVDLQAKVAADEATDANTAALVAAEQAVNDAQQAVIDAQGGQLTSLKAAVTALAATVDPSKLWLDSFDGGTDDDKLTAALSYLGAQTHKQTLCFARNRDHTWTLAGRQPFSGLRVHAGAPPGPLNLEIGNTVPFRHHVNTGGPWWDSTGIDVESTWFGHFACQYGSGARFWRSHYDPGHGLNESPFPIEFEHHAHFGGAGVFGTAAEKCVLTQAVFSGHWFTQGFTDTPYHLGGADMDLWSAGMHNIESQVTGNGKPIIWADYLSNSNIGPIYVTSPNGWRGLLVDGDVAEQKGCHLTVHGGARFEGHQSGLPAYGTLVRVRGGQLTLRDAKVAWPMSKPNSDEHAAIQVEGGDVLIDAVSYDGSTTTAPMVYVAGGTCRVSNAKSITRQPMTVRKVGGVVTADDSVNVTA